MRVKACIKKEKVKILLLQAIIVLFLLVVSDLMLWVFLPVYNPNYELSVTQNLPGLKPNIMFKSRKFGIRSLSQIEDFKPTNMIRILCLGASTTQQSTQETQDTWCGILETNLIKHYENLDFKIRTMAFGAGGYRASDSASWAKGMFDRIEPDIVITLLGINDLALNGGANYIYDSTEERQSSPLERGGILKYWCKHYSQICQRVIYLKRSLITEEWHSSNLPALRNKYRNYPYVENIKRDPDPINEFRDAVNWMVTFFKKHEAQVILLGQPVLWKEHFEPNELNRLWFPINTANGPVRAPGFWLKREMTKYNFTQQEIAKRMEVTYVDLDAKIPKTLDYYFDDCHFTDLGSAAVAENTLPILTRVIDDIIHKKSLTR